MGESHKIAALVLNSVSHDIRVCKEADGLARAGFEVTILGIRDRRDRKPISLRESGVRIIRADPAGWEMYERYRGRMYSSLFAAGSFLLIGVLSVVRPTGLAVDDLILRAVDAIGVIGLFALLASPVAAIWYFRRSFRYWRFARNKAEMLGGGGHEGAASIFAGPRILLRRCSSFARGFVILFRTVRRSARMQRHLHAELDRLKPRFVHCHDLPTLPIGDAWCRRHPGVALVFDSHELFEEVAGLHPVLRWYWRRVLRRQAPRVDGFVTVNQSIAEEHRRRYPALPRAVVVRNAALLLERIPRDDGRLRKAAGLDGCSRILLYQGGFAKERGLENLVRASGDLPSGWVLVMMGWGNLENHLRQIAADVDPDGDRIHFIAPAPQSELRIWTAGADLGVIPYENTCLNHWFCSPNKLWEYAAAGVPILASPFPEMQREILDWGIGRLLPERLLGGDLATLLESIDAHEVSRMASACADFMRADHWEVYQERLDDLYRGLASSSADGRVD